MNVCVIGLGSMGRRRIRLLQQYMPDIIITGVDSCLQRMESVSKEYKIFCCLSLHDTDTKFECAFICTPPQTHSILIQDCLKRDCHIFSEINLIDDLYMENICLAEKKEKVLFLSSTSMYKTEMQYIDKKVKQNKKPCVYQYHFGQYLPDWHPWDDLENFFVSNKKTNGCRELLAIELPWLQNTFGKIVNTHVIKRKLTELNLDFPDTYLIQIEHENGNFGNLLVDVVSRKAVRNFEVLNETLYIRWSGTPDTLYEKDIVTGELKVVGEKDFVHSDGYAEFINEIAYLKEIEDFFSAIKGKKPLYSFETDKEILNVINGIEG